MLTYDDAITTMNLLNAITDLRLRGDNVMHKIGKPTAISSSSRSKLLEIVQALDLPIQPNTLVVTLAEGNGSFLATLLHLHLTLVGVYNSMVQ